LVGIKDASGDAVAPEAVRRRDLLMV